MAEEAAGHEYAYNHYRGWKVYVIRTLQGPWKIGVIDDRGDIVSTGAPKLYDRLDEAKEAAHTLASWFGITMEVVS